MNHIKHLRLARGLTQTELLAKTDHVVSKQALSKYENGKMQPSLPVLLRLAEALAVTPQRLLEPPQFDIAFIAHRQGSRLSKKQEHTIQFQLAEELTLRLKVLCRLHADVRCDVPQFVVKTVEGAEKAAEQLREQWHLGLEPIANVMDVLERHGIHVLPIQESTGAFHGMAAVARDTHTAQPRGFGVAYADGIAGERQRFTLAHELAHLVLADVPKELTEKAANRFAASFLMPAETFVAIVGSKRQTLNLEELHPLKAYFGVSLQALVYRAKDLNIVSKEWTRQFWIDCRKRGWHTAEPQPLPAEQGSLWQHTLRRAASEKQLLAREAKHWQVTHDMDANDPRAILQLPKEERRALLQAQAAQGQHLYAPGSELISWTEEFVDDDIIDDEIDSDEIDEDEGDIAQA